MHKTDRNRSGNVCAVAMRNYIPGMEMNMNLHTWTTSSSTPTYFFSDVLVECLLVQAVQLLGVIMGWLLGAHVVDGPEQNINEAQGSHHGAKVPPALRFCCRAESNETC